jgi:hypothetical protein
MGDCSIRPVLRQIQDAVDQVLGRLTLQSLLCSESQMAVWAAGRPLGVPVVTLPSDAPGSRA